jgi:hypothetical protein
MSGLRAIARPMNQCRAGTFMKSGFGGDLSQASVHEASPTQLSGAP